MKIQRNFQLKPYNTLRVASVAEEFIEVGSVEELAVAADCDQPISILGEGSNVVLLERIRGRVIKLSIRRFEMERCESDLVQLRIGAGENWHELVRRTLGFGVNGLENLALIPGSVGAAPYQNIGAYGRELSEFVDSVEVFDLKTLNCRLMSNKECEFMYRDSVFRSSAETREVITGINLCIRKTNPVFDYPDLSTELARWPVHEITGTTIAESVVRIRRRKLPDVRRIGNVGSFFKNPVLSSDEYDSLKSKLQITGYRFRDSFKVSAARLIDASGWRGYQCGETGVWDRQPLVLINRNRASGLQMLDLARRIADDVRQRYDIELQLEPIVIGSN